MDELNQESTKITRNGKGVIILLATLQGFLLFLLHHFIKDNYPLLQQNSWRALFYSIVLAAPIIVMLSIRDMKDRLPWIFSVIFAFLFGLTAFYTGVQCDYVININCGEPGFIPLIITQAIALFITLFFFQTWLYSGTLSFPYSRLFNYSWFNFLTISLAALFCLIFWSLLSLWAAFSAEPDAVYYLSISGFGAQGRYRLTLAPLKAFDAFEANDL